MQEGLEDLFLNNDGRTSNHYSFIDIKFFILNVPNLLRYKFCHVLSNLIIGKIKLFAHYVLTVQYEKDLMFIEFTARHVSGSLSLFYYLILVLIFSLYSPHCSLIHNLWSIYGLIKLSVFVLLLLLLKKLSLGVEWKLHTVLLHIIEDLEFVHQFFVRTSEKCIGRTHQLI
jgi:hypothetical protein